MGKKSVKSETSKADRKFEKKLQFFANVRDAVAKLKVQKAITKSKKVRSRQKKLKAYDLSSLAEFLPELEVPKQTVPASQPKLNTKGRHRIILKEVDHLKAVLKDPAFQADPFAAIHQHLLRTQPDRDERPPLKNNKGAKRAKVKKSKVPARPQSMEV